MLTTPLAPYCLQWECWFPEGLYPYQKQVDGMWVLNSLYDTAQMGFIFDIGCNLYTTCNATVVAAVQQYAADLNDTIANAQASFSTRDGRCVCKLNLYRVVLRMHCWALTQGCGTVAHCLSAAQVLDLLLPA